uniref:SNF2 N-terminal domain-containing protein n=1 Tax=Strigamia maritima TaxID=126957 RepID=T1IRW3_STRMM
MGARCLGVFSKVSTLKTMTVILDELLPSLGAMENDKKRQGTIEVVAHVIEQLGLDLVPFIVLLVVPVLGRMSDPNQAVRLTATHCFASLVRLMPLENGLRDSPALPLHLIEKKQKEKQFLEQLVDIKKLENYHVPVPIEAELRCYQQEGVNWLFFLNSYKLHGILCDDMGLGKTLQSICILAGDHFNRDQEYKVRVDQNVYVRVRLSKQPEENQVGALLYYMGGHVNEIFDALKLSDDDQKKFETVLASFTNRFIAVVWCSLVNV